MEEKNEQQTSGKAGHDEAARKLPAAKAVLDLEAAKAVLEREKKARVQACAEKVAAVLQEHGCELHASFTVVPPSTIQPNIMVVPKND